MPGKPGKPSNAPLKSAGPVQTGGLRSQAGLRALIFWQPIVKVQHES